MRLIAGLRLILRNRDLLLHFAVVHRNGAGAMCDAVSRDVSVQMSCAAECGLWNEEEDDKNANAGENGQDVEGPFPADAVGHPSDNDRRHKGATEDCEVADCHPLAALVHEVDVADG